MAKVEECKKCQQCKQGQKEHPKDDKETKPAEGTHVPKPKGDAPVIEDRPNGKKEVVSGDKSILIDEIRAKHFAAVEKKYAEAEQAKQEWLKAKEANAPNRNELAEKMNALKKEAENTKKEATKKTFDEVNIYCPQENTIDLHGLDIDGAIDMMMEQIAQRKSKGINTIIVSTGMGHHNTVGYSKIREAVVKKCKDEGMKSDVDESNGFVTITF